jgi:hypothetical protein
VCSVTFVSSFSTCMFWLSSKGLRSSGETNSTKDSLGLSLYLFDQLRGRVGVLEG